jgi:transposase
MKKVNKSASAKQKQQRNKARGKIRGVVGMDLSDKSSTIWRLGRQGERVEQRRIATSQAALTNYFGGQPRLRVVIETGVQVYWVARLLEQLGHEVIAANARKLQLITKSVSKNDRNDSRLLAELGWTNPKLLSPVRLRSQTSQQHRTLLRAREAAVESRTMLINAVRGLAKSHGHRFAKTSSAAFARRATKDCPGELQPALSPLLQMIEMATAQIKLYDRQIEKLCEQYEATQRLMSIRGVGRQTALAYVLALDNDPQWLRRSRDAGAFVGLRPAQQESGDSSPELSITKHGDRLLRKLLVQCAQYILGHWGEESQLRSWGLRLAQGGKRAKRRAVVAVARKLAVILHVLWKRDEDYLAFPRGNPPGQPGCTLAAGAASR